MFAIGAGVIAAAGIGNLLKGSIDEAREAQKVTSQTGAVIKSTGGIANVSAAQIDKLATALSNKIGVDDEAIAAGENMLLTFTNVRNEVGKGNDIFTQATRTVQDMAATFGGDSVTNSKMLGKALNDPVKGTTALTKAGVQFTDKQKEVIKKLVESGDTMGAQKIILKELATQTKGSAEAQVTNADKARVAFDNLKEQIGTALLPVMDRLAKFVTNKIIPAVSGFITGMQDGTGAGGKFRDAIEDLVSSVKGVVGFLVGLPGPVKRFGAEVAIAALILPRLSAALGVAKIQGFITAISTATTRTAALASAAKLAAGVAGLALLMDSTHRTNAALSTLETTAGGAAIGFAVGGPLGAAIGGTAGLVYGLGTKFGKTREAAEQAYAEIQAVKPLEDAKVKLEDLKGTLDQVTGAYTGATRAAVLAHLEESGALAIGAKYGLSTREMINSTLGSKDAFNQMKPVLSNYKDEIANLDQQIADLQEADESWLQPAYKMDSQFGRMTDSALDQVTALEKQKKGLETSLEEVRKIPGTYSKAGRQIRETAAATTEYTGKLKGIPKEARTKILQDGIIPSTKGVAELVARYDLARKDVKTLIAATGIEPTKRNIQSVIDRVAKLKDRTIHITTVFTQQGRPGGTPGEAPSRTSAGTPSNVIPGHFGGKDDLVAGTLGLTPKVVADAVAKASQAVDKAGKKIKEKLSKVRESLASVRSDFASLVEPIASAFTGDLFESTTASDFITSLTAKNGTLSALNAAFKTLIEWGLNPGFLAKLFESGNAGLILDLASNKDAAQTAGGLFGSTMSLSNQLGTAVTGATDKGAALETQTKRLENKLDKLIKHVDESADRTGDRVNGAAANGHRRGHR